MSVRKRHPPKGHLLNPGEHWVKRYGPKLLRQMCPTGYILINHGEWFMVINNPMRPGFRRRK